MPNEAIRRQGRAHRDKASRALSQTLPESRNLSLPTVWAFHKTEFLPSQLIGYPRPALHAAPDTPGHDQYDCNLAVSSVRLGKFLFVKRRTSKKGSLARGPEFKKGIYSHRMQRNSTELIDAKGKHGERAAFGALKSGDMLALPALLHQTSAYRFTQARIFELGKLLAKPRPEPKKQDPQSGL